MVPKIQTIPMIKKNYSLSYRLKATVLLISLFIQSCGNFSNQFAPKAAKTADDTMMSSKQIAIHPLVGHEFTAEKGYVVSFYEQDGSLQASIKVDAAQNEPNYTNVPVVVENRADLLILPYLSKQIQQNRIQLERSLRGQISRVYVFQGGLLGGMKRKRDSSQEEEKAKNEPHQEAKSLIPQVKGVQNAIYVAGGEDEKTEKRSKIEKEEDYQISEKDDVCQTNCVELPVEIWENILSYLSTDEIDKVIYVCRLFYHIATNPKSGWVIEEKDFKGLTKQSVSRFYLNHLIRKAKNLPQEFCSYLPGTQVQELDLNGSNIGGKGITKLAQGLPHSQVHTLNLSVNKIGSQEITKLAWVLPDTQVHTLDLSYNKIASEGVAKLLKLLSTSKVHTLNLCHNKLGVEGAGKIAQELPNLQIQILCLSDNKLGDEGVGKLVQAVPNSKLKLLDLGDNNIGAKGATEIARALLDPASQMHALDLSENSIGDEGADQLAQALPNSRIHTLSLHSNLIGDEGLSKLAQVLPNSQVRVLDLGYNHITDEVASKIIEPLANIQVGIISFDLSGNNISEEIESLLKKQCPYVNFEF